MPINSFEEITIQIDSEAAKAFRSAAPELQQKIQILFSAWVKEVTLKDRTSLKQFMNKISDNAEAKRLTPEILETILSTNMEFVKLGKSDILSSRIVYGCMRIVGDNSVDSRRKGKQAIRTAIEEGYTHFDHADIYGRGQCEELFSEVLKENKGLREKLVITSKCGVRGLNDPEINDPGRYDLSKVHIIKSVEGSLTRLKIDALDLLLLHRPDYLFNPEEISEAFQELQTSGKVLNFGVSNFRSSQVSLLQSCCPMPLLVNQIEINIHNIDALTDGTLDQCLGQHITPQAWCPLGGVVYPAWGNTFSEEDEARIRVELNIQSKKYNVDDWIVMLAWLLKHPSDILPIIGTTTPSRIQAAKKALNIEYSREDWYRLLEARNGHPVP
jgi:predicted oxidoreductase